MAEGDFSPVFLGPEHVQDFLGRAPPGNHILEDGFLAVPRRAHDCEDVNAVELSHAHSDPSTVGGVTEIVGCQCGRIEPFLDTAILKCAIDPWSDAVGGREDMESVEFVYARHERRRGRPIDAEQNRAGGMGLGRRGGNMGAEVEFGASGCGGRV